MIMPLLAYHGTNYAQPVSGFTNTKSMDFDGSNGYIDFGAILANDSTTAFSIAAWVKSDNTGAFKPVVSTQQGSTVGYVLGINSGGTLHFQHRRTLSSRIVVNSTASITAGNWAFIVGTYDGSRSAGGVTFYIDAVAAGLSVSKNTLTGTVSPEDFAIAKRNSGYFDGHIDEVSYWSKELTAAEVTAIYNSGTPNDLSTHSAAANLELWIRGEDNANDSSGNALNGTLTGGVTYSTDVP